MKKEIKKPAPTKVELYTDFNFAYIQNAQNVGMALAQSGYLVNIVVGGTGYRLDVYKRV